MLRRLSSGWLSLMPALTPDHQLPMPTHLMLILASCLVSLHVAAQSIVRPNVLFIVVDDLNDWVGPLGGHPQSKTPNIDALAKRGTLFSNAHAQAPVCNPSRVSLLMGLRPSSSGVHDNTDAMEQSPALTDLASLPEWLSQKGYVTKGCGKVFHASSGEERFDQYGPSGGQGPLPRKRLLMTNEASGSRLWDLGSYPGEEAQYHDVINSRWASEQLLQTHTSPLFLAVGLYRPHVPLYAPKRFFDQHPLEQIILPPSLAEDMDDIPAYGRSLTYNPLPPSHHWFSQEDRWSRAVQAYLASVSFADDCIGRIMRALEAGPMAENTWIILLSDHGFFLGEKHRWAKQALWERATRVPLIMVPPRSLPSSINRAQICHAPVELLSLYPSILDACGLDQPAHLEGRSIIPLLKDATAPWPYPAITTYGDSNHALRTERWRYIRYADGTEEIYDHANDPHEWHNLAAQETVRQPVRALVEQWIP